MPNSVIAGILSAALCVQSVTAGAAEMAAPPQAGNAAAVNANSTAASAPAPVSENWSAATPALPSPFEIRMALREQQAVEEELAEEASRIAAIPNRYGRDTRAERKKYERFARQFELAKHPGCFQRDGLKHQPTFIFGGLLALPFIPIAALRGKCN